MRINLAMHEACNSAELAILQEEWASDWLTRGTWGANKAMSAALNVVLLIPNLIISIPRALLYVIPIINLPFLLLAQLLYMLLVGPVIATSWLWRQARPVGLLVRPLLAVVGVPLALLGTFYCALALIGGPGEDGANKLYKQSLFDSWPLTVEMMSRVGQYYPDW